MSTEAVQNYRTNGAKDGQFKTSSTGEKPAGPSCICDRPKALVICNVCGFETKSRVRTDCAVHPNRRELMDLESCPECRIVNSLEELQGV